MFQTILSYVGGYTLIGLAFSFVLNLKNIIDFINDKYRSGDDLTEIYSSSFLLTLLWLPAIPLFAFCFVVDKHYDRFKLRLNILTAGKVKLLTFMCRINAINTDHARKHISQLEENRKLLLKEKRRKLGM